MAGIIYIIYIIIYIYTYMILYIHIYILYYEYLGSLSLSGLFLEEMGQYV